MDALAHRGNSGTLPWAERVRYSENGVPMMVDDGIWATVTAHGPAPLIVAQAGPFQVFWMGEIEEHGQPAFLALSLRLDGRGITDAAAVIRRKEGRPPFADPAAFDFASLSSPLPPAARSPRIQMTAIAARYLTTLVAPDPRLRLAPGCTLTENGVTQPGGCAARFDPGRAGEIEAVRGLTIAAVDPARGLVAVTGTRDYPARAPISPTADARFPHSYAFAAVFRIEHGAIARVQEVSTPVPYRMPTGEAR